MRQRRIQAWRANLVEDARQAREDFLAGRLRPQSAEEVIVKLHRVLETDM